MSHSEEVLDITGYPAHIQNAYQLICREWLEHEDHKSLVYHHVLHRLLELYAYNSLSFE